MSSVMLGRSAIIWIRCMRKFVCDFLYVLCVCVVQVVFVCVNLYVSGYYMGMLYATFCMCQLYVSRYVLYCFCVCQRKSRVFLLLSNSPTAQPFAFSSRNISPCLQLFKGVAYHVLMRVLPLYCWRYLSWTVLHWPCVYNCVHWLPYLYCMPVCNIIQTHLLHSDHSAWATVVL